MGVEELEPYLREHWSAIREQLLAGSYRPSAVKRQRIPKSGGGVRELGIPTVLDRFVQQLLLQVLQPIFDPTFSEHSHGFRPGRRAHDAVREAQQYIQDGRRWVVDVDLEKFFDRVNHDVLMGKLENRIGDRRVLRIIRRFLEAGVLADGVGVERYEGRRRAALCPRSWRTCSSTKWTRSWRSAGTASCATPMTATCMCGRGGRGSGC
jgi:group II intron reverse transcriptase/maturase